MYLLFELLFHFHFFFVQDIFEGALVEVVDVAIRALLESREELLLYGVIQLSGNKSLLLATNFTTLDLALDRNNSLLPKCTKLLLRLLKLLRTKYGKDGSAGGVNEYETNLACSFILRIRIRY